MKAQPNLRSKDLHLTIRLQDVSKLTSCTSTKVLVIGVDQGGHKTAPLQVNCVGARLVGAPAQLSCARPGLLQ
jgi:hypothetical protein